MSIPFFTVLAPVYNHAPWAPAAMDSLLAQEFKDFEAVMVDDGSTDATPDILAAYANRDSRFRAFRRENGGTAAALNTALSHARGRYVCWLSSDDLFLPTALATHAAGIAAHPECRFFYSHFHYLLEAEGRIADPEPWKPVPEQDWQVMEHLHGVFVHGNSICVERGAFDEAGPFKTDYPRAQDYDMWLRLMERHRAVYLPKRTCVTRVHEGQTTHSFPRACFYDSARAAVDFLNSREFPDLVPHSDLSDPDVAARAVNRLLDLASDPACLAYALGPHHGLTGRLAQWLATDPADPAKKAAMDIVRGRIPDLSAALAGTRLGEILSELPDASLSGEWRPVDVMATAESWLARGAGGVEAEANHLARYLGLEEDWRKPAS